MCAGSGGVGGSSYGAALCSLVVDLGRRIGLDSGARVEEHLHVLAELEPIFYSGLKRYRDHLLHSCRVALLGLYALEQEILLPPEVAVTPGRRRAKLRTHVERLLHSTVASHAARGFPVRWPNERVPGACRRAYEPLEPTHDATESVVHARPRDPNGVWKCWLLAALHHDIGYCVCYLGALVDTNPLLAQGSEAMSRTRRILRDGFDTVASELRTNASALGSLVNYGDVPHGSLAGLHVRSLVENDYWLEIAARAIARHDDHTGRVDFRTEPFSYLLILVDELQEWGRPVTIGPLPASERGMAVAFSILAKAELPSISCSVGDRWEFALDYTGTERTILRDTGFSFARFLYEKHRNLARLGPAMPMTVKVVSNTARHELEELETWARRSSLANAAAWAQEWLDRRSGDCYCFGLGRLGCPPRISGHIREFARR